MTGLKVKILKAPPSPVLYWTWSIGVEHADWVTYLILRVIFIKAGDHEVRY